MAMPVLAEIPGQQELHTRDHGTVKVAGMSFMDGGYHIVKCPNGAYMHSNGLPVENEEQLRAAIPQPFLEDALAWFSHRHEQEENPPQPIGFHPQGYPIFADGTIPDFSDLYAYFSPGPILTAAIVSLQQYIDRTPGFVAQKLKAVPAAPEPKLNVELMKEDTAPVADWRLVAAEKALADMTAEKEAAEKALAAEKTKKAKRSHKKTAKPKAPAPAPEG